MPDYNPDRLYEQYAKCRDAVEQYASRDRYHQWVLQQLKDTTIPGYDVWKRNQILAEMRTRDRAWLNNGTVPSIDFDSEELKKEKLSNSPLEIKTAQRLALHGMHPIFQHDRVLVF